MRGGMASEWAGFFGVSLTELVDQTRALTSRVGVIDQEIAALRMVLRDCPDRELANALGRLERSAYDVGTIVRALHGHTYLDLA
jgi:hypothetical protein